MDNVEVTYVQGDDWSGIYVNGKLFHECHNIHISVIGEIIDWKGCISSYRSFRVENSWLENEVTYPENEDLIPDEVRY